jgi:ferric-dicitrate binding protein FerR (iron transport regulator)
MKSTVHDGCGPTRQVMLRYLDGALSDAEVEDLDAKLQRDPALRRGFAELLLQEVQLGEIGQEKNASATALTISEKRARLSERLRRWLETAISAMRQRPKWALASITAFVGVLIVASVLWLPFNEPQLIEVEGPVIIETGQGTVAARGGAKLRSGDQIVLGSRGTATVGYPMEKTRLQLTDQARVRIERSGTGKTIFLQTGKLTATVAPQSSRAPLRVLTDQAEAKVLGTQFLLSATPRMTQLEVWSGKVRLTRLMDGASVSLVGGQLARAAAGLPLETEAIQGGVLWEAWRGITGSRVEDLTSNPAFPDQPTERGNLAKLEVRWTLGDAYGLRLRGWLHPPKTGDYTFWIAADDEAELWLSRNEAAEAKQRLCYTPHYTESRQWQKDPEQKSTFVHLEAGRKYYLEVLMKQAGGAECLAVAWQGPGFALEIVPEQYLSPLINPQALGEAR